MNALQEHIGPAGTAWQVEPHILDGQGTAIVSLWLINAPGQSIAWNYYVLGCVHLRDMDGVPPADRAFASATHEIALYALDPRDFNMEDQKTWVRLHPVNFVGQFDVPEDKHAADLTDRLAQAVTQGFLWAEPPLSGMREPWQSLITNTAGHYRGEHDDQ